MLFGFQFVQPSQIFIAVSSKSALNPTTDKGAGGKKYKQCKFQFVNLMAAISDFRLGDLSKSSGWSFSKFDNPK